MLGSTSGTGSNVPVAGPTAGTAAAALNGNGIGGPLVTLQQAHVHIESLKIIYDYVIQENITLKAEKKALEEKRN